MSLPTLKYNSYFQFLDICVQVQADESTVHALELINSDFQGFQIPEKENPEVQIKLVQKIKQDHFLIPFVMTSGWAAFGWFSERIVHYSDESSCYRKKQGQIIYAQVQGRTDQRAREVSYDFILSTVGELLEKRGYHRLHAAGLKTKETDSALVLFGLSGTGKSSLVLQALQEEKIQIFSDEIVFFKEGKIFPFPLNVLASEKICQALNLKTEKTFFHSEYQNQKYIFPIPPKKKASASQLGQIALIDTDTHQWATTELSLIDYIAFIFKLVLGLHLPQMTQYFVRADNFVFIFALLFRRLFFAFKLMRYPMFDFHTSKDLQLNYRILKKDLLNLTLKP